MATTRITAAASPRRRIRRIEGFWPMVGRRVLTGPLFALLTVLFILALPILAPLAAAHDAFHQRDKVALRCVGIVTLDLLLHLAGLAILPAIWVFAGFDLERRARWTLRFEVWFARSALRAVTRLFRMTVEVSGQNALSPGPFVLFPRHTSLLDTLLPFDLVAGAHDMHLRYVMKHALIWDPCIDVMGHREPSAFVHRGTQQHGPERAKVAALLDDLAPDDAIVIFPEGTRFTPAKQARRLAWLKEKHPDSWRRASTLRHVLPPRFGGPLVLLDGGTDVVFCAHTGLEGAGRLSDLLAGSLLDGVVRVHFWRVAAADIPEDGAGRMAWLYDAWQRMDDWVDAHRAEATLR